MSIASAVNLSDIGCQGPINMFIQGSNDLLFLMRTKIYLAIIPHEEGQERNKRILDQGFTFVKTIETKDFFVKVSGFLRNMVHHVTLHTYRGKHALTLVCSGELTLFIDDEPQILRLSFSKSSLTNVDKMIASVGDKYAIMPTQTIAQYKHPLPFTNAWLTVSNGTVEEKRKEYMAYLTAQNQHHILRSSRQPAQNPIISRDSKAVNIRVTNGTNTGTETRSHENESDTEEDDDPVPIGNDPIIPIPILRAPLPPVQDEAMNPPTTPPHSNTRSSPGVPKKRKFRHMN